MDAVANGSRVVEVPVALLLCAEGVQVCGKSRLVCTAGIGCRHAIIHGVGVQCSCGRGLLRLFFLLLSQGCNHTVNSSQIDFLRTLGKDLQAVLQLDSAEVWLQLGEYLAATFCLLVLVVFFVEGTDALFIGTSCIDVVLLLPIELAQVQQQCRLVWTILLAFLKAFLPGVDAMCGIFIAEVDVAHGIIDLVEVVLVLVALGHPLQSCNHLTELTLMHHLCLHDACIEGYFVGRIGTYHLGECLVCHRVAPRLVIELCKQEVEAGLGKFASCCLDGILQIGNGFVVLAREDIVCSLGIIHFLLSLAGDAVSSHLVQKVFSIVRPIQCNIASSQFCLGDRHDVGLRTIQPDGVVICGCCFEELSFLELSITHHEPCVVHVRIELLAGEELLLLFRTFLVAFEYRTLLDAVHLDGFLALRDGRLEVALSQVCCRLIGTDIHGKYLVEVVLMAFVLCFAAFEIGHFTVVERIEMCGQGMVGTCGRCVLLCGAGHEQGEQHDGAHHAAAVKMYYGCPFTHTLLYNVRTRDFIVLVPQQSAKLRLSARLGG